MNDESQGDQRGSMAAGGKDSQKGSPDMFEKNGFQVFTFDSKKVVTIGLLSSLVGLCIASISFYKRFGAEIDYRIEHHLPLNTKLIKMEGRIEQVEKDVSGAKSEVKDIRSYVEARKK